MFLERNLYPISMLINVKILIPPSTGTQGGGQHAGGGGPGWEKYCWAIKINNINRILFFIVVKSMVLFNFILLLHVKIRYLQQ